MNGWLLDVNVLLSLVDSAHVHHDHAFQWFRIHSREGWATCPLTENGFVRILSGHGYPNLTLAPSQAVDVLRKLRRGHAATHRFWPAELSITDESVFDPEALHGPRQVTDAYLVALALRRGGKVATFDMTLPWKAVVGAGAGIVEMLPVRRITPPAPPSS